MPLYDHQQKACVAQQCCWNGHKFATSWSALPAGRGLGPSEQEWSLHAPPRYDLDAPRGRSPMMMGAVKVQVMHDGTAGRWQAWQSILVVPHDVSKHRWSNT